MKTRNDREFCNLLACSREVGAQKMPYYMYLMQAAGFDLRYRYSIRVDKLRSHGMVTALGSTISRGYATNRYEITDNGRVALVNMPLTEEDSITCDEVLDYIKNFDIQQLYFLCVVDIIVQSELVTSGYKGLIDNKEEIIKTVKSIVKEYSDDDFDYSIGVFRKLRK